MNAEFYVLKLKPPMQLHTYLKRRVLGTLMYLNQILTYQRVHVLSYQINFHISLLPIVKIKSEIGSLIKKKTDIPNHSLQIYIL